MWSVWSARLLRAKGRHFHSPASLRVCTAWLKARTKVEMEVAINRPMKLRFPQGSEVSTSGCPKFATTGKSGLTNPPMEAEPERTELREWPHRRQGDRAHQFLGVHVRRGGGERAAPDRRHRPQATGARTDPVDG